MKGSICSDHLDICRCFEASLCLLCVSVHSTDDRHRLRAGLSCQTRALKGASCLARMCSVEIDKHLGGSFVVGAKKVPPDDAAAAGGNTTVSGRGWALMVFELPMRIALYSSMMLFEQNFLLQCPRNQTDCMWKILRYWPYVGEICWIITEDCKQQNESEYVTQWSKASADFIFHNFIDKLHIWLLCILAVIYINGFIN